MYTPNAPTLFGAAQSSNVMMSKDTILRPDTLARNVVAFGVDDEHAHEPPEMLTLTAAPTSNDEASICNRRANLDIYRRYLLEEIDIRRRLYRRSDRIHSVLTWIGVVMALAYALCHTVLFNEAGLSSISLIVTTSLVSMWKVCNILSPKSRLNFQIYSLSIMTNEKITSKLKKFFSDNIITHDEYKNLEADFESYRVARTKILDVKKQMPSGTLGIDLM